MYSITYKEKEIIMAKKAVKKKVAKKKKAKTKKKPNY